MSVLIWVLIERDRRDMRYLKKMRDKAGSLFTSHLKAMTLRKKILLSMVILLLLLGLTMALVTRAVLLGALKTEFQRKGISFSRSIAANSLVDVLTQNSSRLKLLIENEKRLDKDIAYIFIVDSSGRILAHTFNKGFPVDLMRANSAPKNGDVKIQPLDTQIGLIYDIAAPISIEKSVLGQVRLGINQNSIQQTIMTLNLIFIAVTLFSMFIGIILAYKLSSLITMPIAKLIEAAQSIQRGDFSTKIHIETKNEIELLAASFNEMASCLNQMVEEKKRLRAFEERNRIAFDLHDGLAQNLADIIKRLELCERLFKLEPSKALEELEGLKKNTRDALNNIRQTIFDLKLTQDAGFNLYDNLTDHINNFKKQNSIDVKLDIYGPIDNIVPDKAKIIFYTIREALNNIRKHSAAGNVIIYLGCDNNDELTVNIKDDGKGFNINETEISACAGRKFGIISMRERVSSIGGLLSIRSKAGEGVEILVKIPLKEQKTEYVI